MKIINYALIFTLVCALIPLPASATCFPRDSFTRIVYQLMQYKIVTQGIALAEYTAKTVTTSPTISGIINYSIPAGFFIASHMSFMWFIHNVLQTKIYFLAYQTDGNQNFLDQVRSHQNWTRLSLLATLASFCGGCYFTYKAIKKDLADEANNQTSKESEK